MLTEVKPEPIRHPGWLGSATLVTWFELAVLLDLGSRRRAAECAYRATARRTFEAHILRGLRCIQYIHRFVSESTKLRTCRRVPGVRA
jgi:hypothetical protein